MKKNENRFKSLPESERPYEKARRHGVEALTDLELLAVLLRQGTRQLDVLGLAESLMDLNGQKEGLPGLMHAGIRDLMDIPGIGEVRAVQILALPELCRRIWRLGTTGSGRPSFSRPKACAAYFMEEMRHLEREQLRLVFLDTQMHFLRDRVLTEGSVDCSLFPVRDVMIEALRNRAVNLILLHNHPSGDPFPSPEDISATEALAEAGKLVGIRLSDHIIIGDNTYYSFRECGKL